MVVAVRYLPYRIPAELSGLFSAHMTHFVVFAESSVGGERSR